MIQVVVAAGVALIVGLFGTPLLIRFLRKHGYSQAIRVSSDGIQYPEHQGKKGTPSMGGLAIIIGVVLGYFVAHLVVWRPPLISGLLCLYLMVGLGLVGMADDYLKIFKQRSTGVQGAHEAAGPGLRRPQLRRARAAVPRPVRAHPASEAISFVRDTPIVLPMVLAVLWIWLLITATTNAVNLTDGLDGLAAGASVVTFSAFALLGVAVRPELRLHALRALLRGARPAGPGGVRARRAPGPVSGSCGGTPARPRSSWATPARWRSAERSPRWPCLARPSCCSSCSAECSS